jgi:hypothetical protein
MHGIHRAPVSTHATNGKSNAGNGRASPIGGGLSLTKLKDGADRLNQLGHEATARVQELEDLLAKCGLNLPIRVAVGGSQKRYVEYRPVAGAKYRIVVTKRRRGGPEQPSRLWVECSREEQFECVVALPTLVTRIASALDQRIASTEASLASLESILERLADSDGG